MAKDERMIVQNKYWDISQEKYKGTSVYFAKMHCGYGEYKTMAYGYSADEVLMELERLLKTNDQTVPTVDHMSSLMEIITSFSEKELKERIIAISKLHKFYAKGDQYYFQELSVPNPIKSGDYTDVSFFIRNLTHDYGNSFEVRESAQKIIKELEHSNSAQTEVLLKTRWFILRKVESTYKMMSIGRYSREERQCAIASTLKDLISALEHERDEYNAREPDQKDRMIDLTRMIQLVKSMAKYDLQAITSDVLNQIKNTQLITQASVIYADQFFTVMQMDFPSDSKEGRYYEIMVHRPHRKPKLLTTGNSKEECWEHIQDKYMHELNLYDAEDVEVIHALRKMGEILVPQLVDKDPFEGGMVDPYEYKTEKHSCLGHYTEIKGEYSTCDRCLTCAYEPECIRISTEKIKTAEKPSSYRTSEERVWANLMKPDSSIASQLDAFAPVVYQESSIHKEDTTMYEKNGYNPKQKNEGMMSSMFQEFCPSEIPEGQVALTMSGKIAVRRKDGNYVLYNEATGTIENQMNFVVSSTSLSKMYILMPQPMNALQPGDIIRDKETWYQVIGATENFSKLKVVNLSTGAEVGIKAESNILIGQKMYRKVFSMLSMVQQQNGMQFNPMMLMLVDQLNKEPELDENGQEKDNSMLKNMLMMSMFTPMMMGMAPQVQPQVNPQSGIQMPTMPAMNPMMLMWMMNSGGSMNDMMPMMLMMGMNNPAMMGMSMPQQNPQPQAPQQSDQTEE